MNKPFHELMEEALKPKEKARPMVTKRKAQGASPAPKPKAHIVQAKGSAAMSQRAL